MINRIQLFFEKRAFGVCGWLGAKLGLKTSKVRVYFIYLSFITFGSPLIVYLILAFLLEHKNLLLSFSKRKSVWEIE
jgi:phage shock protein PspC (stress-responsive transcriptional regulator)